MNEKTYSPGQDPFGGYGHDLHPNERTDINSDAAESFSQKVERSLYDIKELNRSYHQELSDDQLRQIIVLPEGTRLEQGAKYIDLAEAKPAEFTAMGAQEAGPHNYFVAKSDLDYLLWNYLIGVTNPARLDQE